MIRGEEEKKTKGLLAGETITTVNQRKRFVGIRLLSRCVLV